MNKNGKSNILFIILIPIFLILALIIVDTIISYSENKTYKKITEKIIAETVEDNDIGYEEYFEEIKKKYEDNNYETDSLVVEANSYEIYVENEHNYFGLFSSLKKSFREPTKIKILGVEFKAKKNSKTFVKVTVKKDKNNKLEYIYSK